MKVTSLRSVYCILLMLYFPALSIAQAKPSVSRNYEKRKLLDSIAALSNANRALHDSIGLLHDSLLVVTKSFIEAKEITLAERERNLKREAQLTKVMGEVGATDWPSILIGGGIAIVATFMTSLFQYWHRLRNRLFPEFRVQINHDKTQTVADQVVNVEFSVVMFSASSEKVRINYAFLEVPSEMKFNAPSFSSLGDKMFGHAGRFYVNQLENREVDGILYEKIPIANQAILDLINDGKLSKFVVHVHTTKYGDITSQVG